MFLPREHIKELERIKPVKALNAKGKQVTKDSLMIGENHCIFKEIGAGRTKNGNPYFQFTFERSPALLCGEKLSFAPIKCTVFYPDQKLFDLSKSLGHDLKPKPESVDEKTYLNAIFRRFKTLLDKECIVWIYHRRVLARDAYNRPEINDIYGHLTPITPCWQEVAGFGDFKFDWGEAYKYCIYLSEKDQQDYDEILKQSR